MPVLNPLSHLNRHFDDYKLMANHNDFAGMIKEIEFDEDEPSFHFLNLGETHYPYMLDPGTLPHISGVHGVFKRMDDSLGRSEEHTSELQSLMRTSYAVFCLKKKIITQHAR